MEKTRVQNNRLRFEMGERLLETGKRVREMMKLVSQMMKWMIKLTDQGLGLPLGWDRSTPRGQVRLWRKIWSKLATTGSKGLVYRSSPPLDGSGSPLEGRSACQEGRSPYGAKVGQIWLRQAPKDWFIGQVCPWRAGPPIGRVRLSGGLNLTFEKMTKVKDSKHNKHQSKGYG